MAKTNWQDPQSSEIRSTHLSGLMDSVGKIEEALGMQTVSEPGVTLNHVFTKYLADGVTPEYRIYQAPVGKRNWVLSPAPVIKKNGVVITSGFSIDYGGGAIILDSVASASDKFTADVTYVTNKISVNRSEPVEVTASIFSIPSDATEGQISDVQVMGNTVNQIIRNGNFADGTTGWSGATQQSISVSNNILTITGYGEGIAPHAIQRMNNILSGKRYFVRLYARVTTAYNITAYMGFQVAGSTGVKTKSVSNPVVGQWYELSDIVDTSTFTGELKLLIYHQYADAATANGKIMEVKEVMAIDMGLSEADSPLYNLTVDEMRQRFPNWLQYGVVSTETICITSIGKNLFDGEFETGAYEISTGLPVANANYIRNKNKYIRVEPSATYRFSERNKQSKDITAYIYDINKNFISVAYPWTQNALQIPTNGYYVNFAVKDTNINLELQLEKGSVATPYEPYKHSEAYTPTGIILRELPNGVKDVFNVTKGLLTQYTKEYTLQVSDIYQYYTGYTNVDAVFIKKPSDYKYYGIYSGVVAGTILYNNYKEVVKSFNLLDSTEFIGTISAATADIYFYLIVAKGTYANLAAAQAALAGTTLIYQLANPITSKRSSAQALNAGSGYTVIVTPGVIKEEQIYSTSGITVNNTDCPIKEIISIWKVEGNIETPVDISKAVYTVGATTFTITGATPGEKYKYKYKTTKDSTLPTLKYRYNLNISASLSALNELTAKLSAELGDIWLTLLSLADKELAMYMISTISTPASATNEQIANKINEIINVWKG